MEIPDIRDPNLQITLQDWLDETNELFVEVHYPHSGSSGRFYLLRSLADLKHLIEHTRDGAIFLFLQRKQFPLRGLVDDTLISQAIAMIGEGAEYIITDLAAYPEHLSFFGDGQTHKQLHADLYDLQDVFVGIGHVPDTNPTYWKEDMRIDRRTASKKSG